MALTRPSASQLSTSSVDFEDPLIRLNKNQTGANDKDIGIIFERGDNTNSAFFWDESTDRFVLVNTAETGTTDGDVAISSYSTLQVGNLISAGLSYPTVDGTANQVLVTDGNGNLSFTTFTPGAAGNNTEIQFNNSGLIGSSANLTFNGTTLATTGISVSGNIAVTGTVDGRDIAADGAKLDSIESGATADQTGAEIKSLYEAQANTNAFTDAEKTKLGGIEAGADVTDTANVTAAGALMDSEVTNLAAVKSFDPADYATAAQGTLASSAIQPGDNISTLTNNSGYITGNQTITLSGDVSGSGTTSIVVTIADDSHNHIIANIDGLQAALDAKLDDSQKGAANGLAELDATGKVPSAQLPSYVDDVVEYTATANFPATGETGKLYVALDTNDVYRWTGSAYVKVSDAVTSADQATKLATARNIALTGAVTGSANFDGSSNISITTTATSDPTLTINGDASGSATFTNLGNATLTLTVANDSHTHDGRYYTESEINTKLTDGSVTKFNPSSTDTFSGTYPVLWHDDNITPYTSTWFTINGATDTLNVPNINLSGNITVSGTVDGRDVATDGAKLDGIEAGATADQTITAGSGLTGGGTGNVTLSHADTSTQASVNNSDGTVIQDVTLDTYGHVTGLVSYNLDGRYYTESEADSRFVNVTGDTMTGSLAINANDASLTLNDTSGSPTDQGIRIRAESLDANLPGGEGLGIIFEESPTNGSPDTTPAVITTGEFYAQSNQKVFHDAYHPNADKLTTARNIALTGDVTGSANFDGSANISITATVADDSHNHVISNVDGLQTALDGKASTSHIHTLLTANPSYIWSASTNGRDFNLGIESSFVRSADGYPEYGSVVRIATYDNDGSSAELYFPYSATYGGSAMRYRLGQYNQAGWTSWKTVIDDTNIGSYAWTSGNDGSGSGLDADLLDGLHSTSFLRSDTTNTIATFTDLNVDGKITSVGDTNTYTQFHAADQWRVVVGGVERLEVNSSGIAVSGDASANNFNGVASSAKYADLAENYLADYAYPIGTVLEIGGNAEVTIAEKDSYKIAGTVSENPGYLMNSGLEGEYVTPVAYIGRVPCRVVGKIDKGDLLVVGDIPGVAIARHPRDILPGQAIGKALESYNNSAEGLIEILVGRL